VGRLWEPQTKRRGNSNPKGSRLPLINSSFCEDKSACLFPAGFSINRFLPFLSPLPALVSVLICNLTLSYFIVHLSASQLPTGYLRTHLGTKAPQQSTQPPTNPTTTGPTLDHIGRIMDPLSLTAAAVGISRSVTMITDSIRFFSSLKNAPVEVLDLRNEVNTSSYQPKHAFKSRLCAHSP